MAHETRCVKIRLKPDTLERVREWAATLNGFRRAEALATLRDEGVVFEATFLDRTAEGDFLIYVMKAASFETAKRVAAQSTHAIDEYHRQFKNDTWDTRTPIEPLVDLDTLSDPRVRPDQDCSDTRALLRHLLAALAYRTQKALRGAPDSFGAFQAGRQVRTPADLVRHMTGVLGYARTFFVDGHYRAEPLPDLAAEVARFHAMLEDLSGHLDRGTPLNGTTEERLLQGPFADAMSHAGQLAMLRRLAGSPVHPENFIVAAIDPTNLGARQPAPVSPDAEWPEAPAE